MYTFAFWHNGNNTTTTLSRVSTEVGDHSILRFDQIGHPFLSWLNAGITGDL